MSGSGLGWGWPLTRIIYYVCVCVCVCVCVQACMHLCVLSAVAWRMKKSVYMWGEFIFFELIVIVGHASAAVKQLWDVTHVASHMHTPFHCLCWCWLLCGLPQLSTGLTCSASAFSVHCLYISTCIKKSVFTKQNLNNLDSQPMLS